MASDIYKRSIFGIAWIIIMYFSFQYKSIWILIGIFSILEALNLHIARIFVMLISVCFTFVIYTHIDLYKSCVLSVIFIDTACFIMGRSFGRHKFTKISPNKTIEGLIYGFLLTYLFLYKVHAIIIIFICAVLGDLMFSYIKRINKIKDFGFIIPGHGGILDRIDSTIFSVLILHVIRICLILTHLSDK